VPEESNPLHDAIPIYETVAGWIAREAIPIDLQQSEALDAIFDQIIASLAASVELLGFGEALHGGEELLKLRNLLFQRLATAHGYSAIAIESSFPRGQIVGEFVQERGPETFDDLVDIGFSYGFGQLEANRELVEWMREQNADPARNVKLHFYGFDLPTTEDAQGASPRQDIEFALDYLDEMEIAGTTERRQRLNDLLGDDADWEGEAIWRQPGASAEMIARANALRIEVEDLMSDLRVRLPELAPKNTDNAYLDAVQHVAVARQLLTFFAALSRDPAWAEPLGVRDALMADNLAYIVERERGRGKVFVFAHNAHLQRAKMTTPDGINDMWPAGSHLHQLFGARYAVIGTAIGVSPSNGVGQPEDGSIEARLVAGVGDARFIPTHRGREFTDNGISTLAIRSKSPTNPSYFPLTHESFNSFDWLGVIDDVTYFRGGPEQPPASNERVE
jgi:erythromycin esterase-like protein